MDNVLKLNTYTTRHVKLIIYSYISLEGVCKREASTWFKVEECSDCFQIFFQFTMAHADVPRLETGSDCSSYVDHNVKK
jgi:hypothetical protein